MDAAQLAVGFSAAFTLNHLAACVAGAFLGTLIGVLPGLGPMTTIAVLLPFTFSLPPSSAVIMLAGIYYGAQYGGSITAILVNLPGEASSTITCIDGHAMARQGRSGVALRVAAISSFVGGTTGTLILAVSAVPLAALAGRFEAADYTALIVCGLVAAVISARGSAVKSIAMLLCGLLLGAIGTDASTGRARFTMGIPELVDGIGFMPLAIGLFGLADIIGTLAGARDRPLVPVRRGTPWSDPGERTRAVHATLRGTVLGSVLGILPGGGPLMASFASYAIERKYAAGKAALGSGAIEGVAGPESANNAAAQTSFIPLLTLGLPSNPVMALLLGALVVHGIQPGPTVLTTQSTLFWGLVASMWIGNVVLLALNLPFVGMWAMLLRVPYRLLYPTIVVLACTGIYAVNHSTLDLLMVAVFGVAGFLLRGFGFDPMPLLFGFVLSQPAEDNLRRALVFSHGDVTTFVTHPISAVLLGLAVLTVMITAHSRVALFRRTSVTPNTTLSDTNISESADETQSRLRL